MLIDYLKEYLPIILFLIIALGLSFGFIVLNYLLSPKNPDPEKYISIFIRAKRIKN